MTGLTVLGSTGSVGVSTLDVVSRNPGSYSVVALTANSDYEAAGRALERVPRLFTSLTAFPDRGQCSLHKKQ